ncbi:RNA polymerase sigma factor SigJ [Actinomadura rudentiformis]|uniref:Sigma-70 family RNA polymerase sigma factor n=1 Tax=Actinomadura rudentiformis TaxID=359158 RepID=A0A6H9YTP7_9ACTN|nr:RNA polymerase sigma factor SigJ [Actinomadura rudentiformis]KAB2351654.1 sigma-70 family RNA polymerase sigma factor [Actinomadura rudentiformis]
MDENDQLAERFEAHRSHLKSVAYRMLGSLAEAEDVVQEAWFRLSRSDTSEIDNLAGWLTTVVSRICLDMLRSRSARREDPLDVYLPDPIVSRADSGAIDPEQEVLMADSVGLALMIVLETLSPAERLAFVLHDMFAVPFEEIAPIAERSPAATRQLASRARRRVQDAPAPDADLARQREVVDAFVAAARGGDFEALVAVLDPDVVLRVDIGAANKPIFGAAAVAGQALMFQSAAKYAQPALINGVPGLVGVQNGRVTAIQSFTITDGRVVEIHIIADRARLAGLHIDFPAA